MPNQTAAIALLGVLLLACMDAGAGQSAYAPARQRTAVPATAVAFKLSPLPRRVNGRLDSNALFARIAASRAVDVPVLERLDHYKVYALVQAVARNDSVAIERGWRELLALIQALPAAEQKDADIGEIIMVICKAAASEAYAELAGLMNEMNARRHEKEAVRPADDPLTALHARLILCDLKRPCAPPAGKPLQKAGVPSDVLQPGSDVRERRMEALTAAVAMITAHAERMDALAQAILHNVKS